MPNVVTIDDPADIRIAAYRDIRERDLVGRDGLFVAEGQVVLEKLIDSRWYHPQSLLIAAKRLDALAALLARLPDDVPVFAASQRVVDGVAGFPLHRGILAIGARSETSSAETLLAGLPADADVLLLSAIANHDNVGGIFRNAAAFGIAAVLLDADCCDPLYRKAIRVSVGASLLVPFARLGRGEDPLDLLARHRFHTVALSPAGAAILSDWAPQRRNAVLLGAEGPGLSPAMLARTTSLRIPMSAGFDSLNVATTSGIVLHHIAVERRGRIC
ncbi:RNA methyltransferase [Sphingosinicella sp. BN140058]|nr:RNA methyltransferase [Sphingosinicella sp. BN140058]